MVHPSIRALYQVLEATWPPAAKTQLGPWYIRDGAGGGKRVSAATRDGEFKEADIAPAEQAMTDLGQSRLFMIRLGDDRLDDTLDTLGYKIIDPTQLYACPIAAISAGRTNLCTTTHWPTTDPVARIWADGGIGPARLGVMGRATGPKATAVASLAGKAAACGFVALHGNIAMIHAVETQKDMRRQGAARAVMIEAAKWAEQQGATVLALAVTLENKAANALYSDLGMSVVGRYHYRILDPS